MDLKIQMNSKPHYKGGEICNVSLFGKVLEVSLPKAGFTKSPSTDNQQDILLRPKVLEEMFPNNPYTMLMHVIKTTRKRYRNASLTVGSQREQMRKDIEVQVHRKCLDILYRSYVYRYNCMQPHSICWQDFKNVCREVAEQYKELSFPGAVRFESEDGTSCAVEMACWVEAWDELLNHTYLCFDYPKYQGTVEGVNLPWEVYMATKMSERRSERLEREAAKNQTAKDDAQEAVVVQHPQKTTPANAEIILPDEKAIQEEIPCPEELRNNNDDIMEQAGITRKVHNITCEATLTFKLFFQYMTESQLSGYVQALKASLNANYMDITVEGRFALVTFLREVCDGNPASEGVLTDAIRCCCADVDTVFATINNLHSMCQNTASKL